LTSDDLNFQPTNVFVLKTYKTDDARIFYENEVGGFTKLIEYSASGELDENMIGFHGSFVQNGTYNVVLDYADGGTLEEYFQTIERPSKTQDIIDIWSELFNVIKPLQTLHEIPNDNVGENHVYRGYVFTYLPQPT